MQVALMSENYDDYYRKKKEDDYYLKNILEQETDDSELLTLLAYHGQLYYDSLKRIRKLKERLVRKGYAYSAST